MSGRKKLTGIKSWPEDDRPREKLLKKGAKGAVKLCIEETLEHLPSVFNEDLYHQKCGLVYQHVYES
jgi:hypothetical protein